MFLSVFNSITSKNQYKAGLYMNCVVKCQQWLTFSYLFVRCPRSPQMFVVPHKLSNFFGSLLVSYKVSKLRKYWTGVFSCCAEALHWLTALTITRGTETGDEKAKEKCCLSLTLGEKKIHQGDKQPHIYSRVHLPVYPHMCLCLAAKYCVRNWLLNPILSHIFTTHSFYIDLLTN